MQYGPQGTSPYVSILSLITLEAYQYTIKWQFGWQLIESPVAIFWLCVTIQIHGVD